MKTRMNQRHIAVVLVLICCLSLLFGCTPKCFRDEEGYWTTENGDFVIDACSYLAKVVVDGSAYYFDISTNAPGNKVHLSNEYSNYAVLGKSEQDVMLGVIPSYKMGSGKLDLTIETDNYFDYAGKTVSMKLVPYSNSSDNILNDDSEWVNLSDGSTYFFSDGIWEGKYNGEDFSGWISVFPTDEVVSCYFTTSNGDTTNHHSYIAEVTEKSENEITFRIIASDGVFADRLGESFVLTKQTEAAS